ncbi:MAG: hypothetical protein HW388_605 [Dehalococcoidia bacterium]|nr:hypothetical protein [Dehalococcoidia bacterium]
MNERDKTVFLDEEIEPRILAIIREAEKQVVLVTPYLALWGHAQAAMGLAVKKGIKVTVIIRREDKRNEKGKDAVAWLLKNGVDVMEVESLHAKIYMNEHALLVSSMNLTGYSVDNSLEIAVVVTNEHEQQRLRDYVNNRVMRMAKSLGKTGIAESLGKAFVKAIANLEVAVSGPSAKGVCIRCGRPHLFDPSKPLCDGCYDSWAEYGNEEYPEHFCLRCGRPAEVTYAKPLCRSCWSGQRR